jgi:protein-S-isoprenylcysteine O-methyltransferase Ste14
LQSDAVDVPANAGGPQRHANRWVLSRPLHRATTPDEDMIAVLAALYGLIVPGALTVAMPWLLLRDDPPREPAPGWFQHLGWIPVTLGTAMICLCVRDLVRRGRGTPAPALPPAHLVTDGLYRWTRNPMYVGILAVLLGEALVFWSREILFAAAATWMCMELFLQIFEERTLKRRFGHEYDAYRRTVPRWIGWPWGWKPGRSARAGLEGG